MLFKNWNVADWKDDFKDKYFRDSLFPFEQTFIHLFDLVNDSKTPTSQETWCMWSWFLKDYQRWLFERNLLNETKETIQRFDVSIHVYDLLLNSLSKN